MRILKLYQKINPKWLLTVSHLTLISISILYFNLQRTFEQMSFAYAVGIVIEFFFFKISNKYPKGKWIDRFFSVMTEVSGLIILLNSSHWWFHGLLASLTIIGKYVILKNENEHVFNPINLTITFALIFMPNDWFNSWTDEYMTHWYPMAHVTFFGIIAVYLGNVWRISLSYFLGILICCYLLFLPTKMSEFIYAFGPEFGTIGLIFLWSMITDPKTTPKNHVHQWLFGFLVAFIHIYMRKEQLMYSRFISLFIVTFIFYVYYFIKLADKNKKALF